MAIQTTTIQLKFRDTQPKSLRYGQIQVGSVSVDGLAPNEYIVDYTKSVISAIQPHGDILYNITFQYDDTRTIDNTIAQKDATDAIKRDQLQAARATLQTIIDTPNASLTQVMRDNALRTLCRGMLWVVDRLIRKGLL